MATDPVGLLKEVAKRFGKRVHDTNLFDANVCTRLAAPERPWEILAPPGEVFRHKLNITVAGHNVILYANRVFVVSHIPASLAVSVFSINRRDKIMALERSALRVSGFPSLPVFSGTPRADLEDVLRSQTLTRVLAALDLGEDESLHVYGNGPHLYFRPESPERLLSALDALRRFVEELPTLDEEAPVDGLPPTLEHLSSLIPKWAISDDDLRGEMLEQKSSEELRTFIAAVEPQMAAINDHLNSFGEEPLPGSAAALGTLCECAEEAKLILGGG